MEQTKQWEGTKLILLVHTRDSWYLFNRIQYLEELTGNRGA